MEKSIALSTLANSKFSRSESEVVEATKAKLISSCSDEELIHLASKLISAVKFKLGLNTVNNIEEEVQIEMLVLDLRDFNHLTISEVSLALKRGLNGEYLNPNENQVYFNSSNFVIWIKKYLQSKTDTMKKITNSGSSESEPSKKPSDAVLKAQAIETINFYASQLQKAQDHETNFTWIAGGLHVLYDIADSFKLIRLSREEKLEIFNKHMGILKDVETAKQASKADGYKKFIHNLVDFGCRLDANGETKPF
jgi:hypothetical protein